MLYLYILPISIIQKVEISQGQSKNLFGWSFNTGLKKKKSDLKYYFGFAQCLSLFCLNTFKELIAFWSHFLFEINSFGLVCGVF